MLWGCTVREAMSRCPPAEFAEWRAFERLEPWGEWRADFRMGKICQAIAVFCGRQSMSPSDFMHDFDGDGEKPELQSPDEMLQQLEAFEDS